MSGYAVPTDPDALADEIATTAAHLAAGTHRLLTCIRAFDVSEEWGHQGAVNCAHWLSWRINMGPAVAREKVRVARALGTLPQIDDALRRGVLSYSQVRALTRVATPQNEADLLSMARSCTAAQLERLCRKIRRAVALTDQGDRPDDYRSVTDQALENGLVRITITLHPDEAALVMKAIEHARRQSAPVAPLPAPAPSCDVSAETRPRLPPRADALVSVVQTYLAHHDRSGRADPRTQIFLHVDQDPLAPDGTLAATLDDGTRVSAEAFRRLSCDATVAPVHHSPTAPQLDLGRRTRTISPALRRALTLRDRGCAFPCCPNPLFLHAHHIVHWAQGGPTSLPNLALLCSTHHRFVHEGGFGLRRDADGNLVFTDPRGKLLATTPAPRELDGGADALAACNEDGGLEIDAQTGFPGWDGERMDYLWAVDSVLRE
jgi:uncharacterized protein DUF222/HNH endonuclease